LVVKSETVAVLAVLPRYPGHYRGNGSKFYGFTAVLGSRYVGIPWGRGPGKNLSGTGRNGADFYFRVTL